jgi:hypothetical protein
MLLGDSADSEKLADALLAKLEEIFGSLVFDTRVAMIVENNLGGEMDIRRAVMQRPDLFERAFIGILGEIGERILANVCSKLQTEFHLDGNIAYAKAGDLARCMAITIRK